MGLNFGRLLDYGLPIGMSFIPGVGPVMAGVISGGITAARTGSLMKGLSSGLMAGGLNAGVGSLAGNAAGNGSELLGGPEFFPQEATPELLGGTAEAQASMPQAGPAASQTVADRFNGLTNSSGSQVYDAFFPKGGGLITPGGAAGAGLLGQYSADVKTDRDRSMQQVRDNLNAQNQRDRSRAIASMTPIRPYNYEDPYQVAYQGRKTPFFGNADGGEIKKPPPPKKDESILDRLINGWQAGAESKYPPPPVKQGGGNGKYANGGKVESEEEAKAHIERQQRQDAAELATEQASRKYMSTANVLAEIGYHTPKGEIYDSLIVGRPGTPTGHWNPNANKRFQRGAYADGGQVDADRHYETLKRLRSGEDSLPDGRWQRLDKEIEVDDEDGTGTVRYADHTGTYVHPRTMLNSRRDVARERSAQANRVRMASGGIVTMDQYGMGRWKGPAGGEYVSPYLVGIGGATSQTLALPGNQSGFASSGSAPANAAPPQPVPFLPFQPGAGGEGSDGGPSAAGADAGSSAGGDGSGDYMQGGIVALAGGGFAPMPGSTVPKQHRRSGASMIRSMYPDRQTAASDSRSPDSPIKQMGVKGPNDPLLRAAFADQAGLGRLVNGPGDGRSDSVPAVINGRQPAALSDGEFIIPASAVSAIGKGSSKSGAQKLQRMIDRVHKPKRVALPA